MSMYTPPSDQRGTGAEGAEFIDVETGPEDENEAKERRESIERATKDADKANGEPDAADS
jgi:hypothetical protein